MTRPAVRPHYSDRVSASPVPAPWHVRAARFAEPRPWLTDTVIFVLPLLGLTALLYLGMSPRGSLWDPWGFWGLAVTLELLAVLPLALRRAHPAGMVVLVATAAVLQVVTLVGPGVSLLCVPIVVFSAAKFGSKRVSRTALALGAGGSLTLPVFFYLNAAPYRDGPWMDPWYVGMLGAMALFCAMVIVTSWLFGDLAGRRRVEIDAINERNRLLEREREQEARLAADAERMRIAREMHDVISHSMSVMIAQADGGRYVVHDDPVAAKQAFSTVAATGRGALTEMRRMLGVLRDVDEDALRAPMPTHADLPRLIADVRAAGLQVEFRGPNQVIPELPEGAGLALYRIVQEALTNTMKHAGPGVHAEVDLIAEASELTVVVRDDGLGSRAHDDGSGSGIVGMRERATLYGGRVATQASDDGFTVIARFPVGLSGEDA